MKKGDKVKVIDPNTVWADKVGTVAWEGEEIVTREGKDFTPVEVVLTLATEDGDQSVRFDFVRDQLELVESEALENLNEAKEEERFPSFENGTEFKSYFIGKKASFKGINFEDVFELHEIEKGLFDYSAEDKAEINIYLAHEGETARITDCAINDWDEYIGTEKSFENSY